MKLAKVLALFMAIILAFVFISAPVALSGGGTSDKNPWDEDSIGGDDGAEGGYTDYVGLEGNGDDCLDDPDDGTYSTGVIWFIQSLDFQSVVRIVTLYQGVSSESNGDVTNVISSE
jgi:hypothetical protein